MSLETHPGLAGFFVGHGNLRSREELQVEQALRLNSEPKKISRKFRWAGNHLAGFRRLVRHPTTGGE